MSLTLTWKSGAFMAPAILLAGLLAVGCSSDNGSGVPAPDSSAPEITNGPSVSSLTETSARITWTTSEAATSAVDFGVSTAYGTSQSSTDLSTTHSVLVTDLNPYTTYHCRVVSADAGGNAVTSTDVTFTTDRDYALYMSDGWTALAGNDIESARTSFAGAMAKDATSGNPHVGLGWCDWKSGDLAGAYTEFYGAVALDSENLDAIAARCVVGTDRGEYAQSIADAEQVLSANPTYSFPDVETFNYMDLHVSLARCYYAQGDYAAAQEHVDLVNPHNPLNPGGAGYTTLLLSTINRLYAELVSGSSIGGGRPPTTPAGQGI
jgi:hypothetical protein